MRGESIALVLVVGLAAGCGRAGFDPRGLPGDSDAGETVDSGGAGPVDVPPGCVAPEGAVVQLSFEEGTGLQTADRSGNSNDGQLVGMDESDWVPGRVGGALDFDGVDDRVVAGSDASVDDVVPLTMCAWISPRSYPSNFPTIADKSIDSFIGGWFFYIEDNAQFGFQTNRRKWITGGTIALGTWTHVCVTWDGSDGFAGIELFQDGMPTAMKNSGSNGNQLDSDAARQLTVGRVNDGSFPFDGIIDELVMYPNVLTPQQIALVHGCPAGGD